MVEGGGGDSSSSSSSRSSVAVVVVVVIVVVVGRGGGSGLEVVLESYTLLYLTSNSFQMYVYIYKIHSFIHSVFCLTTGPKPPPKRCLHILRSRASSFK